MQRSILSNPDEKILLHCVNELLRRQVFFTPFSCTNVQVIWNWKTFVCLKIARKKTFKTGAKVT